MCLEWAAEEGVQMIGGGTFNSRNDTELKFTNFVAMSFHVTVRSS